jgi:hypothetical protein
VRKNTLSEIKRKRLAALQLIKGIFPATLRLRFGSRHGACNPLPRRIDVFIMDRAGVAVPVPGVPD